MKMSSLLLPACVVLTPLTAVADNTLVTFDGAIGAIPVASGVGGGATATTVNLNNIRGVNAPNTPWTIADFQAEVTADGHITANGKGLIFAGGNTIGTAIGTSASGGAAVINVFATLICENTAPFTDRNTNAKGVPLAANGDFKIDDLLSPPPPAPSACATPVLLIRNAGNQNYFAAGIQNFGTQNSQ